MNCRELNGIYRGKVLATDASESEKKGRIKVEVPPYLVGKGTEALVGTDTAVELNKNTTIKIEGMSVSDLPWAVPAAPLFFGAAPTVGSISIPAVGSHVFVFFEGGDIYSPVYFANAVNGVATIPAEASTDYPQTAVLKTPNGITITINDNTGDVTITSTNKLNLTSGEDMTLTVAGDLLANVAGNQTSTILGNLTAAVTGGIAVTALGATTITGTGAISVEADSISLTGNSAINLN